MFSEFKKENKKKIFLRIYSRKSTIFLVFFFLINTEWNYIQRFVLSNRLVASCNRKPGEKNTRPVRRLVSREKKKEKKEQKRRKWTQLPFSVNRNFTE